MKKNYLTHSLKNLSISQELSLQINKYLMKLNKLRFKKFQIKNKNKLKNHFYIIVAPYTIHLLEPCLRFIPKDINIFLILNGLRKFEKHYIRRNFSTYPTFELFTYSYKVGEFFVHGEVLNLLFKNNKNNFGVIDHDCYILDSKIFDKLKIIKNNFLISIYNKMNKKANLTFPKTYALFFNINQVKKIMEKYKINCLYYNYKINSIYFQKIPLQVQKKLGEIKLDYNNYPDGRINFFDTLELIFSMAIYENYLLNF